MLSTAEILQMIRNMSNCPLPNKYSDMILDSLHEKRNSPTILQGTYHNYLYYDYLGRLNDDICFLGIDTNYSGFIPALSKGLHKTEILYDSLNVYYIDAGAMRPASMIVVGTIVPFLNENEPDPVAVEKSMNRFLAMIRMAFGMDGFHYICSLSYDPYMLDAQFGRYDAEVDQAASRILTSEIASPSTLDRGDACTLGDEAVYLSKSKCCQEAMLRSIKDKKLRDVTEMYMKL